MKKYTLMMITISVFLMSSCKPAILIISNDLKTNTAVMDVKKTNKLLSYGAYKTSVVQRKTSVQRKTNTHNKDNSSPISTQKINFIQFTPDSTNYAEVLTVAKRHTKDPAIFESFGMHGPKEANYFSGLITPAKKDMNKWEFLIYELIIEDNLSTDVGIAKNEAGAEIKINALRRFENSVSWSAIMNLGFEFVYNEKVIGTVDVVNEKVWIKNDISDDLKLFVSSISSSLLLVDMGMFQAF